MITLNGKQESENFATVTELLEKRGYRREIIVVEINGIIIKKEDYDTTAIKDGDTIEIVHFMGGGSVAFR
ncbi:MAG: sulfur carrier protein ThiS [Oscillospiraceae bacterium]|nr:sulfur carrier protein ThiS [Oscillospiraceae bacterium]